MQRVLHLDCRTLFFLVQRGWNIVAARPRSDFAIVTLRVMSLVSGLAYVKVYTGELTVDEIGTFFYLSTLSYALNALVFLPVDFYMQARIAEFASVPAAAIRRLILVTLAAGLVGCALVSAPFVYMHKLQIADLPWLYAVAALLYLCTSLRNLLNNRSSPVLVSIMMLMESAGRVLGFVALAAVLGRSARTLMISSALALALELIVILWQCPRRLSFTAEPRRLDPPSTIVSTAIALAGGAICNTVQLQAYRVAYPLFGLSGTSGIYGVVANVGASAMAACASIYSQIETPKLYQSQGRSIEGFVKLAIALSLAVLLVAMVLNSFLIRHLTQEKYVAYSLAIGFGVIIEACNLITGGYAVCLMFYQRAGALLNLHVLGTVVSVVGCFATLTWYPRSPMLIGAVLAGSQLLITPFMGLLVRRQQTGNK
jgi:hypothetical protein